MEDLKNDINLLSRVKFIFLLVLHVAAILVTLLIFIFLAKQRSVLKAPHNHGIFIVLVVNTIQLFVDMPLGLHFYSINRVAPAVPNYCLWWTFSNYTIFTTCEFLLMVISVQRHMFIFYQHILQSRWSRILLHYLPLFIASIYPFTFYSFAILLYPCMQNYWDYNKKFCGYGNCYLYENMSLGTFDILFNNSLPILIDLIASALLFIRVILRKAHIQRLPRWGQYRRMIIQLFSLSALYLITWIPFLAIALTITLGGPIVLSDLQEKYFSDILYLAYLLFPWLSLGFFPEFKKWIRNVFTRRRRLVGMVCSQLPNTNTNA